MESAAKIDKNLVEDVLPLTAMQEGLLFHYVSSPGSLEYFEQLSLRLRGELDENRLKEAWQLVAAENEMLRTVFRWEKLDKPVQVILKYHDIPFEIERLGKLKAEELEAALEEIRLRDRGRQLDIRAAPMRIKLIKIDNLCSELLISNHHIIFDGWSNGVLLSELFSAYGCLMAGTVPARKHKTAFGEYVNISRGQDTGKNKEFWKSYLDGFEIRTPLPVSIKPSDITGMGEYSIKLAQGLTGELAEFARKMRITAAGVLYCAWGVLLMKYGNQKDVVFGTTVSGRTAPLEGIERMAGLFINTIPLRLRAEEGTSVQQLLARLSRDLMDREEFEGTPLMEIKACGPTGTSENLFDTIVVVENYPLDSFLSQENLPVSLEDYKMFEQTSFDLTLVINIFKGMELKFSYKKHTFNNEAVKRLAGHYLNILKEIIGRAWEKVEDICILSSREQQILFDFNNTAVDYPYNRSIMSLFEEQVEKTPDKDALLFGSSRMSYRELNQRANRLAWTLLEKGVTEEQVIGLMVERSFEMVIGIYGILKAGAAYVPIDPDYPAERVRYLLDNARASILLTQGALLKKYENAAGGETQMLAIDHILSETGGALDNPLIEYNPQHLMYLLYTSGSTGSPKGAMVKAHSFVNLVNWYTREFDIDENSRALLIAPISFDLAQKNLYAPLIKGGTLCIFDPGLYDYNKMSEFIEKQAVDMVNCSPGAFYPLLDLNRDTAFEKLKSLKKVFLGGETINTGRLAAWAASPCCAAELVNTYGPTECTDISNFYRIPVRELKADFSIPVGRAIDNVEVYILDQDLNPVPTGVSGELCISGAGLGRGYYNHAGLTAAKFKKWERFSGKMLYRTGDIARLTEDGNVEYIGRIDNQVKIRGYRVELGEIEKTLEAHPEVTEAVVVDKLFENGVKYLCAYFTAASPREIGGEDLKEHLASNLPGFMVPSFYTRVEAMPLTPNGKIDRKALWEQGLHISQHMGTKKPENEVEQKLVELWQKVLGIPVTAIDHNFFEVGGNSILIMQLHAAIEKNYPGRLAVTDLFSYPTVEKQAAAILGTTKKANEEEAQVLEPGETMLSSEYFTVDSCCGESVVFRAALANKTSEDLTVYARDTGFSVETVFTALLCYLLFEISGSEAVAVNVVADDGRVMKIEVNIPECGGFQGLLTRVLELLKHGGGKVFPQEMALSRLRRQLHKRNSLVPVLYRGDESAKISLPSDIFNLQLEYAQEGGAFVFCSQHNAAMLNGDRAAFILEEYLRLIELFVEENKGGAK